MPLTESTMLPLGTIAPDFHLLDTVSGKSLSLKELVSDKATVIMFICNHCPFVKHIENKLVEVAKLYQAKGINFIAICANDANNYPADAPEQMTLTAKRLNFSFPYLHDQSQEIAKAYEAACTPDFYVFDHDLKLVYRGRFDDSRPGNDLPVTGKDLTTALDCLLAGKAITEEQFSSMGCNIKWKG